MLSGNGNGNGNESGSVNSKPAAPRAESGPAPTPALDRALVLAKAFLAWLSRPRVRLAVVGVILLMIGGLLVTNSVWTLPLVVVGALMVSIAWIGRRLDGRFAVEWGDAGTQLEFRAKIKAPQHTRPALTPSGWPESARIAEPESDGAGMIEGEAHTVEIEVSELEALIAAVESTSGQDGPAGASAQAGRDFQVARWPEPQASDGAPAEFGGTDRA